LEPAGDGSPPPPAGAAAAAADRQIDFIARYAYILTKQNWVAILRIVQHALEDLEGEEPGALKGAARGVMQFCPGGGANLDLDLVARLLPKEVLTIVFNIVSSRLAACGQPA
jgi:hypothetical protein